MGTTGRQASGGRARTELALQTVDQPAEGARFELAG
jgi:hypothetical protein